MQTATDVVQLSLVLPEELSAPPGVLKKARQAWKRAWEAARNLAATGRVLLQAIYRRLGNDLFCWPSQATLAADAGISERSVRRWLPRLEQAGWITRSKRITQRGQITDMIQITAPEQGVFSRSQGGQVGHPSPANLAAEKGSKEKASEHSSSAACAREAGLKKPRRDGAAARQEGKEPVVGYVRDLLTLWRELVPSLRQRYGRHWKGVGAPCASWLSGFAPAHLEEAFARLLVRIQSGRCSSSPRGLYKVLVLAVGQDVEGPQRHSADRLRAMIRKPLERSEAQRQAHREQGRGADVEVVALPGRPARSERSASPPSAPGEREPGRQARQMCAAAGDVEPSGSAGSGLAVASLSSGESPRTRRLTGAHVFAREEEYFRRARQVTQGLGPTQWEEACQVLLDVCAQGLCSRDAAARAMSAMWSWDRSVCLGLLLEKVVRS
jgi:hypothetical protein